MKVHLGRPQNSLQGTFQLVRFVPLSRLIQQHAFNDDVGVERSRGNIV
jgi:hypothetical protein